MNTKPDRHTVHCDGCGLIQYEREFCRKCHSILPDPRDIIINPETVEVEVEVIRHWTEMEPLPTVAQLERMLIEEALERAGDHHVNKAAEMIGIGKTTIYRKLKEYQNA